MSNKIEVVKFEPKHMEELTVRPEQGPCPKTVLTTAATFMWKGEVIAVVGGFPFIPGVIHFWAMLSDKITKCPIQFHKTCLDYLRWYEVNEKPYRIQLEVSTTYEKGCRWAESLGFTCEGVMKNWLGYNKDAFLYGRAAQCQQ